jgi:hypothetical protein
MWRTVRQLRIVRTVAEAALYQPVLLLAGPDPEKPADVEPAPEQRPLFGDQVQQFIARTSKRELANWREKLMREGVGPADFLTRVMADAYEEGNTERVIECAALLLPYTLPRLNAVMVAPGMGAGLAGAGGVVQFSWAPAPVASNEGSQHAQG